MFKFLQVMQHEGRVCAKVGAEPGSILYSAGDVSADTRDLSIPESMTKIRQFSGRKPQFSLSLVGAIGVLTAGLITLLNLFFGFGGF
jgi:hypothetical protein